MVDLSNLNTDGATITVKQGPWWWISRALIVFVVFALWGYGLYHWGRHTQRAEDRERAEEIVRHTQSQTKRSAEEKARDGAVLEKQVGQIDIESMTDEDIIACAELVNTI